MNTDKIKVHFTDSDLIDATNPVTVNLIGAGGTGSKVLTGLLEMNHSLIALGHAGLHVRLWDDDIVTEANLGRQRFSECEKGLYKSVKWKLDYDLTKIQSNFQFQLTFFL